MEKNIDVEKIMREIREEVARRCLNGDLMSFDKIPLNSESDLYQDGIFDNNKLQNNLVYLNDNYRVQTYRVLRSRPVVGGIILFFKKLLRKSMKFYIEPIVNDQNEVNAAIVQCINQINCYVKSQIDMQEELEKMKKTLAQLEKENLELKRKL